MSNFIHTAGTNGFTSTFTIISSTELSGLVNGNTVTSAASGTSGKFNQTNFGNATKGLIWFTALGAFTPTTGGVLTGWWLHSPDGGTTFEKTVANTAMPRPPDFTIPLFASAYANGDLAFAVGEPKLPWDTVKAFIQNNAGVNLSANNHTITCGPVLDTFA